MTINERASYVIHNIMELAHREGGYLKVDPAFGSYHYEIVRSAKHGDGVWVVGITPDFDESVKGIFDTYGPSLTTDLSFAQVWFEEDCVFSAVISMNRYMVRTYIEGSWEDFWTIDSREKLFIAT